ncbi:MAG: hypothetical protein WDO71_22560 [Bacteroidota bacterium]
MAYGTAAVATTTTWQIIPGMTMSITVPAGRTAKILVHAEVGLNTNCATNGGIRPLVIAIALILSACGGKQQQQQGPPPAIPVTVEDVKSTEAVYYDEYPGTIVALNQTELRAQVTGVCYRHLFQRWR